MVLGVRTSLINGQFTMISQGSNPLAAAQLQVDLSTVVLRYRDQEHGGTGPPLRWLVGWLGGCGW